MDRQSSQTDQCIADKYKNGYKLLYDKKEQKKAEKLVDLIDELKDGEVAALPFHCLRADGVVNRRERVFNFFDDNLDAHRCQPN